MDGKRKLEQTMLPHSKRCTILTRSVSGIAVFEMEALRTCVGSRHSQLWYRAEHPDGCRLGRDLPDRLPQAIKVGHQECELAAASVVVLGETWGGQTVACPD